MQRISFKHHLFRAAMAVVLLSPSVAFAQDGLDGAIGRIFDVDLDARRFEILKETEYDPVTAAGRSHFTVHWTTGTVITHTEGNAFTSGHGANNAELWLGNHQAKGLHWDVIQFNHGLHDIRQPAGLLVQSTHTRQRWIAPDEPWRQ